MKSVLVTLVVSVVVLSVNSLPAKSQDYYKRAFEKAENLYELIIETPLRLYIFVGQENPELEAIIREKLDTRMKIIDSFMKYLVEYIRRGIIDAENVKIELVKIGDILTAARETIQDDLENLSKDLRSFIKIFLNSNAYEGSIYATEIYNLCSLEIE